MNDEKWKELGEFYDATRKMLKEWASLARNNRVPIPPLYVAFGDGACTVKNCRGETIFVSEDIEESYAYISLRVQLLKKGYQI